MEEAIVRIQRVPNGFIIHEGDGQYSDRTKDILGVVLDAAGLGAVVADYALGMITTVETPTIS